MKFAAILTALWAMSAQDAHAYQVSCSGSPLTATITSVLGEPRPASVGVPDRFHGGVDVTECNSLNSVQAIEGGTVRTTTACGGSTCIRVVASNGHAFDYVHINPTVSIGATVTAGQTLGAIVNGGDHLHLNEIQPLGTSNFRVNPQRPGALVFSDGNQPEFVPTTIGAVTDQSIIPVQEGTATPFTYRGSTFYVKGSVDVFINARDGSSRKGLYEVGARPRTAGHLFSGQINLTFNNLHDNGGTAGEVQTLYYYRNSDSDTFIGTNKKINDNPAQQVQDSTWNTDLELPGAVQLCGNLTDYPQGHAREQCVNVVIDRTAATITMSNAGGTVANGGATSTATITIAGTDSGGIQTIKLEGPSYSSTSYVSGVQMSAQVTFPDSGTMGDGSYTATVTDLAGNAAEAGFEIDTSGSSPGAGPGSGPSSSTAPLTNNQCIVLKSSNTISGICKIWSEFSSSTAVFAGGTSEGTYALSICGVSTGTYIVYAQTCAGVVSSTAVVISSAPVRETLAGSGAGWSSSNSADVGGMSTLQSYFQADTGVTTCDILSMTANGQTLTCQPQCGGCAVYYRGDFGPPAQSFSWTVTNVSLSSYTSTITFGAGVSGYNNQIGFNWAPDTGHALAPGASLVGNVTIPEVANATYTYTKYSSTLSVSSPYSGVILSTRATLTGAEESARLRQVLRQSGHIVEVTADGGMAVFNSTLTLRLEYTDAAIDTTTARIYRLNGPEWESNSMFSQTISRSGNNITTVGLSTFTSTFVVFFDGQDSSAPVTTFAIQGSSFVFDQALFVSTDAFVVLTATDPAVNGYASTVASITYRLDPSSGSPFYIYSSSIPLPLGTHILEYRSLDYAGNTETVKTATFTVTTGAAMRASSTAQVPGVLLNGFLGSGAKLEIESQAENSLTLLISSANRAGMVAVDNIGEVGIGVTPQANLNIGQGAIALQLRSGNSTSAVTSSQIALAYNGDNSMRHLLRTEHSTATHGNKLDFLVWNTGAASTTTVAGLGVLSLQGIASASGGSFHVQPIGEPDAEVEVSNGLSTGGGTMQRLQVVSPSSRRFKTDIKDLRAKDEDRALADVAALKHARFRYKTRRKDGRLVEDPAQTLHTGLIYEEAPDSIREGGEALSTTERLVNVELALKASMRRLEELQARYERLKAKRRNP